MKPELTPHTIAISCITLLMLISLVTALLLSFFAGPDLNEAQKAVLDMASIGWKAGFAALAAVLVGSRIKLL